MFILTIYWPQSVTKDGYPSEIVQNCMFYIRALLHDDYHIEPVPELLQCSRCTCPRAHDTGGNSGLAADATVCLITYSTLWKQEQLNCPTIKLLHLTTLANVFGCVKVIISVQQSYSSLSLRNTMCGIRELVEMHVSHMQCARPESPEYTL